MDRERMIGELTNGSWDVIVIGGGASGLGAAVDAQARGFRTLLLEQADFAKGTSSRSTKLVHGGVRYLKQGDISLVNEALYERGLLCHNAAHLVHDLAFVVPIYHWWQGPFYGIGLKLYDMLAGKLNIAHSRHLGHEETLRRIPNIEQKHLQGGIMYHDAQFDDARLSTTLARTAADLGATVLNYVRVDELIKDNGMVAGVRAIDTETDTSYELRSKVVINATGIFADRVRAMDDTVAEPVISPSQGVHIVLDKSFQPTDTAIMVPQTDDGRVLFVIPWHERVLVGTTDTAMETPELEPTATKQEVEFILRNAARYLQRDPSESDILSIFAGQRPLVHPGGAKSATAKISREHLVEISPSGLVSIMGGKWTTYRRMAEDTINHAITVAGLPDRPSKTKDLKLHGWMSRDDTALPRAGHLQMYGAEAAEVMTFLEEGTRKELLHPRLPYAEGQVTWAARHELARTLEDVLARRTRSLLLDARASIDAAPRAAALLAEELGRDQDWIDEQVTSYGELAKGYLPG
ncbi:Aerobic glycerol-3-phosphate dehydrogenase [Planctomycetes bacterium Pan216]|uniref:Aerobic glycerol-3-phosphate dehydrogenase n=1 Tax=Kolteria novifilia TaxID=2527975 RepID=A0A518B7Z1_9BACT|nr:Aerobic glycerol-3-phosphate dehydrogenase [Planctomycetes bacterium Pan216]